MHMVTCQSVIWLYVIGYVVTLPSFVIGFLMAPSSADKRNLQCSEAERNRSTK